MPPSGSDRKPDDEDGDRQEHSGLPAPVVVRDRIAITEFPVMTAGEAV
jgi:hypothetical protein